MSRPPASSGSPRCAVVGHVEWCAFASVDHVPEAGEIVEAPTGWEQAAGGGAVAAVQIAQLAGGCRFFTALADDEFGHRAKLDLEAMGLDVEVAWRPGSQRRAFVHLDAAGERTITVTGDRLVPVATDPLPWGDLDGVDAIYVTAADAGAIVAARAASKLIATVRAGAALSASEVQLDALVASAGDRGERYVRGDIVPTPEFAVLTEGKAGGTLETADGSRSRWQAAPLPGPRVDSYGAGDSFAGGLTFALGRGDEIGDALALAARCGAACVTGRGPYAGQLSAGGLA